MVVCKEGTLVATSAAPAAPVSASTCMMAATSTATSGLACRTRRRTGGVRQGGAHRVWEAARRPRHLAC